MEDVRHLVENETEYAPGKWGPARPVFYGCMLSRIRDAWLVLIGRAAAVRWF